MTDNPGEPGGAARPAARQAILLITDTTRWDMLGCYRDTGIATPHLDRLAAEGMRFERAYTCTPVCGPARAALLSGTWPHGNGGLANGMALAKNAHTLGQRVADAGLRAGYIGKWHLDGTDYFGNGRCPAGWDNGTWYDGRRYLEELSPQDRMRSRDPRTGRDTPIPSEFTFAHRCSDRAIQFLERYRDSGFLLVVSYDEPHGPSLSPEPYAHAYDEFSFPAGPNVADTLQRKPEHQRVWAGERLRADRSAVRVRSPGYFGAQSFVDAQIGRVLAAIGRLTPDALVCYTSDHGDALESHCLTNKGPAMYDEIARIPLLIRWPGVVPPGSVYRYPASHIDLAPTLLDALGCPVPPFLDGASMLPSLRDPGIRHSEAIFCEYARYEIDHDGFGGFQPLRGIFDGRHKLVINLLSGDELYDLDSDPGEMDNLIDSAGHAAVRDRLHDRLLDWMHASRDPFRGYYWERRPWRADAAAATWADRGMTRQREYDGYQPRMLDYDTGLPMEAAVRAKRFAP